MLQGVCFWLSEKAVRSLSFNHTIEGLTGELAAHGLTVERMESFPPGMERPEEYFRKEGADGNCFTAAAVSVARQQDILYITDQPESYAVLSGQGRYVLPYYHEYNRGAAFPGAFYAIERLEEMDYESLDMAYRRLAGLPWNILETDRLRVRETTEADVDCFYQMYGEPSVAEYMEPLFEDREEETAYIKDYIEKVYAFYGYGMWTVLERESGQVVGRAGISWREGYDLPELGFVIGVPWQGRGYAFEVCDAILSYAREELLMERVQAFVRPDNRKSLGLCERLGFTVSGETEADGKMYLLLVKDFGRELSAVNERRDVPCDSVR